MLWSKPHDSSPQSIRSDSVVFSQRSPGNTKLGISRYFLRKKGNQNCQNRNSRRAPAVVFQLYTQQMTGKYSRRPYNHKQPSCWFFFLVALLCLPFTIYHPPSICVGFVAYKAYRNSYSERPPGTDAGLPCRGICQSDLSSQCSVVTESSVWFSSVFVFFVLLIFSLYYSSWDFDQSLICGAAFPLRLHRDAAQTYKPYVISVHNWS